MLLALAALLGGCRSAVLDPGGAVALEQRNIILVSTGLMLLIIVPVMILTIVFAWRYRQGNEAADYDPDFDHSAGLELAIWAAPLLIVICLGALTWSSTHLLDPYRRLDAESAVKLVDSKAKPLRIQVVSLDWKWLFIYPEQGIASVNELALPVNRQVKFELTSTNMMNTFYAPTLAGMIYTMPGMTSIMHAVLNRAGESEGYSANYSGAGFSDMRFRLRGLDGGGFDRWVAQARASTLPLSTPNYLRLERPSEKVAPMLFARVQPDLFGRIVARCVHPGTPCMGAGREAPPPNGQKPEGALFKTPGEIAPAPSVTKQRQPGTPGNAEPKSPRNRDMT